jgi:hypothetical protein
MYDRSRDLFYLMPNDSTGATGPTIYVATPTRDVNLHIVKLTWSTKAFTGASKYVAGVGSSYNRWQYVDAIDAIIVCPTSFNPMECWKL